MPGTLRRPSRLSPVMRGENSPQNSASHLIRGSRGRVGRHAAQVGWVRRRCRAEVGKSLPCLWPAKVFPGRS
jgi:hypothetical protein